jgi:holliday junction DNA helicase RuvA
LIDSLEGKVSRIDNEGIAIEAGGIGFYLMCSRGVFREAEEGSPMRVLASLQVSDAGPALFGFIDEAERSLFYLLLKVRGVGSRLAMTILRTMELGNVVTAISADDTAVLCQVPGVGKKTAERLCFELKQGLEKSGLEGFARSESIDNTNVVQFVIDAMESLGFTRSEARLAVTRVVEDRPSLPESPEELLREALDKIRRS